jgi:hypothetical protein
VARYVRDNLSSTLKAYFEYSNEIWNFGFSQTALSVARGAYLGFPNSSGRQQNGYYGLRVRQIMTAVTAAWAPRSVASLRRVLAVWESDPSPSTANRYRLGGADLDTRLNYTNYNSAIGASYNSGGPLFTRPIDVCDTISYATYYAGPNLGGNSGNLGVLNAADIASLKLAADNYQAGAATGNQSLIASALAWVDSDIRRGSAQKRAVTVGSDLKTFTTAGAVPAAGMAIMFSSNGMLPTGLSPEIVYFAVNQRGSTFQISTNANGAPLDGITISGNEAVYIGQLGGETLLWHKNFYYGGWEQVAAGYDGLRPPGAASLKVECYEGGLEACPPSQGQCNAAGLDGAIYGTTTKSSNSGYLQSGAGGAIYAMLQAYKNSPLAKKLVLDQFAQFMAYKHSATPAWYALQGFSQWSLMPGNTLTKPYGLFEGVAAYNSASR